MSRRSGTLTREASEYWREKGLRSLPTADDKSSSQRLITTRLENCDNAESLACLKVREHWIDGIREHLLDLLP